MPSNINFRANVWALKEAGCTHMLVSSACGSLREDYAPGDLVLFDQFIDRFASFIVLSKNVCKHDLIAFPTLSRKKVICFTESLCILMRLRSAALENKLWMQVPEISPVSVCLSGQQNALSHSLMGAPWAHLGSATSQWTLHFVPTQEKCWGKQPKIWVWNATWQGLLWPLKGHDSPRWQRVACSGHGVGTSSTWPPFLR